MVTRRFDDDELASPPDKLQNTSSPRRDPQAKPKRPTRAQLAASKRRSPRGGKKRKGPHAHIPRTLTQVLSEADEMIVSGDLSDYVPLPTGFSPLDGVIGGGLRNTELVLLGGPQGIGKTITALQIARNIAMHSSYYTFFVSYEHTETHLMNRLLCLESVNPPAMDTNKGVRLKDLYGLVTGDSGGRTRWDGGRGSLRAVLSRDQHASVALQRMQTYSDRLILVKASPAVTTLRAIREMISRLCDATKGKVVVFIDYLQKVAIHPLRAVDEAEKVTIIVEGLKDLALALGVPVFSIVAADREGLKSKRLHLYNLRGSSALDYECDIAVIMNNKYHILSKEHIAFNPYEAKKYRDWVIFTVEKNRAGRAMVDMEFQLFAQYFAFDPHGRQVQQQLIDDKIIEQ